MVAPQDTPSGCPSRPTRRRNPAALPPTEHGAMPGVLDRSHPGIDRPTLWTVVQVFPTAGRGPGTWRHPRSSMTTGRSPGTTTHTREPPRNHRGHGERENRPPARSDPPSRYRGPGKIPKLLGATAGNPCRNPNRPREAGRFHLPSRGCRQLPVRPMRFPDPPGPHPPREQVVRSGLPRPRQPQTPPRPRPATLPLETAILPPADDHHESVGDTQNRMDAMRSQDQNRPASGADAGTHGAGNGVQAQGECQPPPVAQRQFDPRSRPSAAASVHRNRQAPRAGGQHHRRQGSGARVRISTRPASSGRPEHFPMQG